MTNGSFIPFLLLGRAVGNVEEGSARSAARIVGQKWAGGAEAKGGICRYDTWRCVRAEGMPASDAVLAGLMNVEMPLTETQDVCALNARINRLEVGPIDQSF